MRARESGVDELAGIGMPWMHGQLIAVLDGADDLVDVGDHQPRIDTLAEQIERQGDDIDIPVRSPLPKSVPSTRSAPAITASSVAATAVPRSLCGCTLRTIESRSRMLRPNHSI